MRHRYILATMLALGLGVSAYACGGDDTDNPPGDGDAGPDSKNDVRADTTRPDGSGEAGEDASDDRGSDTGKPDADADGGVGDADSGVTPGKFMVVRVGDLVDAAAPADLASPVFLDEYDTTGALLRSIALPTAPSGDNYGFWLSNFGTNREGLLSRSGDGTHVVLVGYAANAGLGIPPFNDPPWSPRVLARVDSAGSVDTSTVALTPFRYNDIGGGTCNGTDCWMVGWGTWGWDGPPGSGVQHLARGNGVGWDGGGDPSHTDITGNNGPRNAAAIFDGQLYVSSNAAPIPVDPDAGDADPPPPPPPPNGILKVGNGLPTTGLVAETVIASPLDAYSFVFLDTDGTEGVDTLYVACNGNMSIDGGATLAGVNKYTRAADAGAWTWAARFASGLTSGARGLAAFKEGANVVVVVTDSEGFNVIKYVDDGVDTNPAGTTLATSPAGIHYTGVAQSPAP